MPAHVVVLAEPVGVVEGRVGEDVVGAEVEALVGEEGVGELFAEIEVDAVDSHVHCGEALGGGVALFRPYPAGALCATKWTLGPFALAVNGDRAESAAVGLDKGRKVGAEAVGGVPELLVEVVEELLVGGGGGGRHAAP